MPKWVVYEDKKTKCKGAALLFEPEDAQHPDLPLYIKEKRLPVVVNEVGGFHSFAGPDHDVWDDCRFVEYLDFKRGEKPSFDFCDVVPKNEPNFECGWVDRLGNTYSCGNRDHRRCANLIKKELYANDDMDGEQLLEKEGWVKVGIPGGWMDQFDGGVVFTRAPSKKQINRLIDLGRYTPRVERDIKLTSLVESENAVAEHSDTLCP